MTSSIQSLTLRTLPDNKTITPGNSAIVIIKLEESWICLLHEVAYKILPNIFPHYSLNSNKSGETISFTGYRESYNEDRDFIGYDESCTHELALHDIDLTQCNVLCNNKTGITNIDFFSNALSHLTTQKPLYCVLSLNNDNKFFENLFTTFFGQKLAKFNKENKKKFTPKDYKLVGALDICSRKSNSLEAYIKKIINISIKELNRLDSFSRLELLLKQLNKHEKTESD